MSFGGFCGPLRQVADDGCMKHISVEFEASSFRRMHFEQVFVLTPGRVLDDKAVPHFLRGEISTTKKNVSSRVRKGDTPEFFSPANNSFRVKKSIPETVLLIAPTAADNEVLECEQAKTFNSQAFSHHVVHKIDTRVRQNTSSKRLTL